jgi:hypothetical protein
MRIHAWVQIQVCQTYAMKPSWFSSWLQISGLEFRSTSRGTLSTHKWPYLIIQTKLLSFIKCIISKLTKMRLILCTHLLIVAASLAAAQGPKAPATELDTQLVSWIFFFFVI